MKFKNILVLFVFSFSAISFASNRNLCDDLVDSGTSSEADILRCLHDSRFGRSDHYKEMEALKQNNANIGKFEEEKNTKEKENVEIKKFTEDDLFNAGFGKPFYAIRGDWRHNNYKEKRITEGDNLCQFLGYEKALMSKVSGELWENKNNIVKVDKQGLILDTNIWGKLKSPEIYRDEENEFTVRKYVEISCLRRKDKELSGSSDALKAVVEDLIRLPDDLNANSTSSNPAMNNESRSGTGKETSLTPFGYKRMEINLGPTTTIPK
jgi:hypothetical protein